MMPVKPNVYIVLHQNSSSAESIVQETLQVVKLLLIAFFCVVTADVAA
jgi:hypothetical protein